MSAEIKNCPHCDGLGELVRDEPIPGAGFVECHDCGARGGISRPDEAVRLWNQRVERTCKSVTDHGYRFRFTCSACGYVALVHNCVIRYDEVPNYCPNCGAKVVEG